MQEGDAPATRDDVLAECLAAWERGDRDAIAAARARHPTLEAEILGIVEAADRLSAHAQGCSLPGPRIGRFEVVRELGRGGAGIVYLARDPALGREVALKWIASAFAPTTASIQRFRRETQALARIRHPGIATIYDCGEDDHGIPWCTMEYISGRSLAMILDDQRGANPGRLRARDLFPRCASPDSGHVEAMVRIAIEIADALQHAHECAIIHRDVKPGNVIVDDEGKPWLVDFGLALLDESAQITRTGMSPGTPLYMAPEQVSGGQGATGPWTDVYGLGMTLHHALTLRPPFRGTTTLEVLEHVLHDDAPSVRRLNSAVSRELSTVLAKATEKHPARRYASASAFRDDLAAVLEGREISARSVGPVSRAFRWMRRHRTAAAACLVAGLVASSWILANAKAWQWRLQAASSLAGAESILNELTPLEIRWEQDRFGLERFAADDERREIRRLGALVEGLREDYESALNACSHALDRARLWTVGWPSHSLDAERARIRRTLADAIASRGERRHAFELSAQADAIAPGPEEPRWAVELDAGAAEVFLFGHRSYDSLPGRADEVPRLVPVPVDSNGRPIDMGLGGFQPGDPCLRIISVEPDGSAARAGLGPGDLIHSIEGQDLSRALYVASVDPDSMADRAGISPFDRIVRIGGREVGSLHEWECPRAFASAAPVEYVFASKAGREISLSVPIPVPEASPDDLILPARMRLRAEGLREAHALGSGERSLGVRVVTAVELLELAPSRTLAIGCISAGVLLDVQWPAGRKLGAAAELTAYPLVFSPCNRLDPDAGALLLPKGSYLAIARAVGHVDHRRPFVVDGGPVRHTLMLVRVEDALPGYLCIESSSFSFQGDSEVSLSEPPRTVRLERFWMARHEVTFREWCEFIEDQADELRPGETLDPSLFPHFPGGGLYGSEGTGLIGRRHLPIPGNAASDSPVVGIQDGRAIERFLEWKNARPESNGWRFRLPTQEQWELAARGVDGRAHVWGDDFDFSLCNSLHARFRHGGDVLWLEPVGRFPTDESVWGIRDLEGSACESNAGSIRPFESWTPVRGGSWVTSYRPHFRAASREAGRSSMPDLGLRLVAERR